MRNALFAAVAAATVLASGILGGRANATPLAPSSARMGAAADAALVQQATNVCGANGCVRVQTSAPRKRQHGAHHP